MLIDCKNYRWEGVCDWFFFSCVICCRFHLCLCHKHNVRIHILTANFHYVFSFRGQSCCVFDTQMTQNPMYPNSCEIFARENEKTTTTTTTLILLVLRMQNVVRDNKMQLNIISLISSSTNLKKKMDIWTNCVCIWCRWRRQQRRWWWRRQLCRR